MGEPSRLFEVTVRDPRTRDCSDCEECLELRGQGFGRACRHLVRRAMTRNAALARAGDVQGVLDNGYTINCADVVPGT